MACSFVWKKGLLSDHLNLLLDKGQILSITVLLADDASLLADKPCLLATFNFTGGWLLVTGG
ncbi:hypothetical protein COJ96_15165 [Bacillus sp. AFS073361]|uniref:hypothetical protein n=1 Tax=Bacillus sp. AFS073361 TaxID=2033511 RepID=UPI000BF4AF7C|nr:hypothetical protein [Bacillus sp. AFS073361]PFP27569.1 hypothetical protein COJ96_15165 [Bacillus sp. AFS073361]